MVLTICHCYDIGPSDCGFPGKYTLTLVAASAAATRCAQAAGDDPAVPAVGGFIRKGVGLK